ncbi:MAG: carboxypeptidase-like regulatory domain-containing protein [Bacteroidia bacterium]|nr:carboxypeptidase-like regulatory domain-containing protein [Bacteroidia bacterium]
MKRYLFILIFILYTSLMFAQGKFSVEGQVLNSSDSSAIEMVAIVIKELNIWSVSDQKGFFILKNVPAGSYILQVTSLGYEPVERAIKLTDNLKGIIIYLNQITLAIDEVIVVAKEGKKMGTGSTIQQTALQHVQPTDLSLEHS